MALARFAVAAVFLPAAAQAAAQSAGGAAPSELAQAIQRKDWPRAVELAQAEAQMPTSPRAAYNLACVHALAGQEDAAIQALSLRRARRARALGPAAALRRFWLTPALWRPAPWRAGCR